MDNQLEWSQVAVRLGLTVVFAAIIGFERETNSRPAGLRTTLLVALAACVAMIQANLLLSLRGKASDSYVVLDLMRLPLGILSGMGFIGAGAILRRDNLVVGVTTASTLWFVTVMGLCFGGGQLAVGMTAAVLGIVILNGLRKIEPRLRHNQRASIELVLDQGSPTEGEVFGLLRTRGYRIGEWSLSIEKGTGRRRFTGDLHWRGIAAEPWDQALLSDLFSCPGVLEAKWSQTGAGKETE